MPHRCNPGSPSLNMRCTGCNTPTRDTTADLLCLRCVEKARDSLVVEIQRAHERHRELERHVGAQPWEPLPKRTCRFCGDVGTVMLDVCEPCGKKL